MIRNLNDPLNVLAPPTLRLRLKTLIRQPIFIFVTIWGHLVVFVGTFLIHRFESGSNPKLGGYLDAAYWAVSTVTSVGSADFAPVTVEGKITGMAMMIAGSLFLWSYTAIIVGWLIAPEIHLVQREIADIETLVDQGARELKWDHLQIEQLKILLKHIQTPRVK